MSKSVDDGTNWVGGTAYIRCRQQFQVLFLRYGFKQALAYAEEVILWPNSRRPHPDLYLRWAEEADDGKAVIPPKVEEAFNKRLDSMIRSHAEHVVIANSKAAVALAAKAADGKLSEADAKILVAANNGAGFVYREIIGGQKKVTETQTTILLPFKEPPRRKLPQGSPAIEAQFEVKESVGRAH